MSKNTLRVLARGTALTPNYEHAAGGRNSFIGTDCRAIGAESEDVQIERGQIVRNKVRAAVFVRRVGEVVEVPDRKEYRKHVKDGDLWAADQDTAEKCGVAFDPTFGGEHDDEVKHETAKAVEAMAAGNL